MTVMTGRAITNAVTPEPVHDWRHLSACAAEDPDLFFPLGGSPEAASQAEQAKAVCRRCPVMEECLAWAVETRQAAGVWGGMTENERRNMQRRQVKSNERARDGKHAAAHIVENRLQEFLTLQEKNLDSRGIAAAMRTNVQTIHNVQRALAAAGQTVDQDDIDGFLTGSIPFLATRELELAAYVVGVNRGMTYIDIDKSREVKEGSTSQFVSRMRKRFKQDGRPFPKMQHRSTPKFTDAEVVKIREEYAAGGIKDIELALKYRVERKTITCLLSGDNYRDVGGPIREKRKPNASPSIATRILWSGGQGGFLKNAV